MKKEMILRKNEKGKNVEKEKRKKQLIAKKIDMIGNTIG